MDDYLLEDGSGKYLLEDASGYIEMEAAATFDFGINSMQVSLMGVGQI